MRLTPLKQIVFLFSLILGFFGILAFFLEIPTSRIIDFGFL